MAVSRTTYTSFTRARLTGPSVLGRKNNHPGLYLDPLFLMKICDSSLEFNFFSTSANQDGADPASTKTTKTKSKKKGRRVTTKNDDRKNNDTSSDNNASVEQKGVEVEKSSSSSGKDEKKLPRYGEHGDTSESGIDFSSLLHTGNAPANKLCVVKVLVLDLDLLRSLYRYTMMELDSKYPLKMHSWVEIVSSLDFIRAFQTLLIIRLNFFTYQFSLSDYKPVLNLSIPGPIHHILTVLGSFVDSSYNTEFIAVLSPACYYKYKCELDGKVKVLNRNNFLMKPAELQRVFHTINDLLKGSGMVTMIGLPGYQVESSYAALNCWFDNLKFLNSSTGTSANHFLPITLTNPIESNLIIFDLSGNSGRGNSIAQLWSLGTKLRCDILDAIAISLFSEKGDLHYQVEQLKTATDEAASKFQVLLRGEPKVWVIVYLLGSGFSLSFARQDSESSYFDFYFETDYRRFAPVEPIIETELKGISSSAEFFGSRLQSENVLPQRIRCFHRDEISQLLGAYVGLFMTDKKSD